MVQKFFDLNRTIIHEFYRFSNIPKRICARAYFNVLGMEVSRKGALTVKTQTMMNTINQDYDSPEMKKIIGRVQNIFFWEFVESARYFSISGLVVKVTMSVANRFDFSPSQMCKFYQPAGTLVVRHTTCYSAGAKYHRILYLTNLSVMIIVPTFLVISI